jgi:hypothetical protein
MYRYGAMFQGSQQLSVPLKQYENYINKINKHPVEVFSSPFNSQLMRLDPDGKKGYKYCSIYANDPDSLGSFFNNTFENSLLLINPPYIEKILSTTAIHLLNMMDKNNDFVFYGPCWRDSDYFVIMNRVRLYKKILKPGEYYFTKKDGKKFYTNAVSIIFSTFKID